MFAFDIDHPGTRGKYVRPPVGDGGHRLSEGTCTHRENMINEAQITIRNAGFLLAQRGFHIIGWSLIRYMGTSNDGPQRLWAIRADHRPLPLVRVGSDLGFTQIMGRYVPHFMLHGEKEKLQKFFSNLWVVSLVERGNRRMPLPLFTSLWLPDLDLFLFMMMSATLLVRAATHPFFTLFLGLNQAARWGMGETFRHWFLIFLVIIGFYLNGLRGAFMGLFLTELARAIHRYLGGGSLISLGKTCVWTYAISSPTFDSVLCFSLSISSPQLFNAVERY